MAENPYSADYSSSGNGWDGLAVRPADSMPFRRYGGEGCEVSGSGASFLRATGRTCDRATASEWEVHHHGGVILGADCVACGGAGWWGRLTGGCCSGVEFCVSATGVGGVCISSVAVEDDRWYAAPELRFANAAVREVGVAGKC